MTIRSGHARFFLVGLLLTLLASCATDRMSDRVAADVPLWLHFRNGAIHVLFRRELTASSRTVGEAYERGRAEIDPVHSRVFVGSSDQGLYALRATDGSSIWRFETLGMVQSEPTYDKELDVVYFGSNDGALYAVRAGDGGLLWRFDSGAEIARKAVLSGDTLVVANAGDQLFALNRRTGKTVWATHRAPALGMEIAGYAGPCVASDVVYMAYSDGHVEAYNVADGSEKWSPIDLSAEAEGISSSTGPKYLDVDTTPVVATVELPSGPTSVLFVASYAGGVVAVDANKGGRVWSNEKVTGVTDLMMWSQPAHQPSSFGRYAGGPTVPAQHILFASSASTGLHAIDPTNGAILWRNPVPDGGITAPVQIAGAILVGTSRYGMFLIAVDSGKTIDGFHVGTGFSQTPAAYGDRAYALTNGGVFVGMSIYPRVPYAN